MEFSEDGFGALVSDDPGVEPMVVEDCLRISVWRSLDGRQFIVADSGPGKGSKVDLHAFHARYADATASLAVGDAAKTSRLQIWFLAWCREPSCRCLISAKSLYEELGLDQFDRRWWRWSWAGLPIWRKRMKEFGLEAHVVRGLHCEAMCSIMRFASWSPSRHVGETRVYLEGSGCQRIIVSRLSVCVGGAGSGFAPPPSDVVCLRCSKPLC